MLPASNLATRSTSSAVSPPRNIYNSSIYVAHKITEHTREFSSVEERLANQGMASVHAQPVQYLLIVGAACTVFFSRRTQCNRWRQSRTPLFLFLFSGAHTRGKRHHHGTIKRDNTTYYCSGSMSREPKAGGTNLTPLVSHCTPFSGARSAPELGAEAALPRLVLRPPQPPAPPGSTPQPAMSASQYTKQVGKI